MKKILIVLLAMVLIHVNIVAEIKNGYETRINEISIELENLKKRINEYKNKDLKSIDRLTSHQKQKLNFEIDSLNQVILNCELTERLLYQFRNIAPDLFNEIDTIKNAYGEKTDVYVKFVPDENMTESQLGSTLMGPCLDDENICYSEYGIRTVLVLIYTRIKPLFVLAHEFGHVKYQVPHLASYMVYFKKTYLDQSFKGYFIGHYPTDPSGEVALRYERRFRKYFKIYKKNTSII
jgi:hypothetical protein